MASSSSSLLAALPGRLLASLPSTSRWWTAPSIPRIHGAAAPTTATTTASRPFSTTPPVAAGPPMPAGALRGVPASRTKRMLAERDPKIKILDKALYKLKFVPPPLRMGRNRYLRHWTIHRAWLLFRRQRREQRERELMRQYQSMHRACEELRTSAGPGLRDTGYLYRVAMEKKGVYRHGGIPIEYARPQTETPAREPWNHDWKR